MGKKKDRGWEYLNSDSESEFDFDQDHDGSWGISNDDGSGSFYGADGSWGYKEADGRASYYGADGSWGYRDTDGRVSYYGANGSTGSREAHESSSSDDIDTGDDSDSGGSALASVLGALLVGGAALYGDIKAKKEQERIEEQRRLEQEQWRREQERQRKRERAASRRSSRWSFYKRHWKAILVIIAVLVVSVGAWSVYNRISKSIPVGVSSDSLIGEPYEKVVAILEDNGFSSIHVTPIYDLSISQAASEGKTKTVTISGKRSFDSTDSFPFDSKIEVTYHVVKNISVPMSSEDAVDYDYIELKRAFTNAGFTNVRYEVIYDLILGWFVSDGEVESVSIDGDTSFSSSASYRPDVEVVITYHTFKSNKDN